MRRSSLLISTLLLALALALTVSGCRVQEVVRTEFEVLHVRDSVFHWHFDTVRIVQKGDTILIRENVREVFGGFHVLRDTVRSCDTVKIVERVEVENGKTTLKERFTNGILWIFGVFWAVLALFLGVKILKK